MFFPKWLFGIKYLLAGLNAEQGYKHTMKSPGSYQEATGGWGGLGLGTPAASTSGGRDRNEIPPPVRPEA